MAVYFCDCVRGCLGCVITQRSGQGASHQRNPLPTRQSNETTTTKTTEAKQHMSHGRPMGRERIGKIDQDAPRCPRKARHRQPPQAYVRRAGRGALARFSSQPASRAASSESSTAAATAAGPSRACDARTFFHWTDGIVARGSGSRRAMRAWP
jgi:hypothetical protein